METFAKNTVNEAKKAVTLPLSFPWYMARWRDYTVTMATLPQVWTKYFWETWSQVYKP